MAKEEKKHEEGKGKKKRMHLHSIRSEYAGDGSIVHHHTYKDSKESPHTHPERGPMATSKTPDEAGQHVAEMFAQNEGAPQPGAEPEEGQGQQPQPGEEEEPAE